MTATGTVQEPIRPLDFAAVLLVTLIWGVNFVAVKWGVAHFPPIFMTAIRFTLVAVVLCWALKPQPGRMGWLVLLSITFGGLHFGAFFTGMTQVDAAVGVIVMLLCVPFASILSTLVFKERFGWRRAIGMVIAFGGVLVIVGEPRTASNITYVLILVGSAFAWGLGNLVVKKIGPMNVFTMNAWMAVFAVPQLLAVSLMVESGQWQSLVTAGPMPWVGVGFTALISSVIAYGIWYKMIDRYGVGRVVPITLLEPVFGVGAAVLILGEVLTVQAVLGAIITTLGVLLIQTRFRRTRSSPRLPRE